MRLTSLVGVSLSKVDHRECRTVTQTEQFPPGNRSNGVHGPAWCPRLVGVMGYDEAQRRRQQIQQRLADLELRLEALSARRGQFERLPTRKGSTPGQRRRAHASQPAAQEQLATSVEELFRALMFAAEAHDRAAIVHEQL